MEYKIKYPNDNKPRIGVIIKEITDGVHLIYCDFSDRLCYEGEGSGDEEGWESIFFSDDCDILIEVSYKPERNGILVGDMTKKTFHGVHIAMYRYQQLLGVEEDSDCLETR